MLNPYLMVNGCHSCLAIDGIFMKAQSPGEYLNPSGRLICNVVTLEGKVFALMTKLFPCPMIVDKALKIFSTKKMTNGAITHFQNAGA